VAMSILPLAQASPARVLVIDDEAILLRTAERVLSKAGFVVSTARCAEEAAVQIHRADLVLCDDGLPGMRGSALLESLRSQNVVVPFILMTGAATAEGVVDAYEGGVTSFILKPFRADDLVSRVRAALEQSANGVAHPESGPRVQSLRRRAHESLDRALAGLTVAYQPIVSWSEKRVFGYEALMRSSEAALPHPGAVLEAAENLDRLHEVGRRVRELVATSFRDAPADTLLFLNVHPHDLNDPTLYAETSPIADLAGRVVLEITERADFHDVKDGTARLAELRDLGYRIAVDDLGAGYAGLTSIVELDPHMLKVDMGLVRDLDRDSRKRHVVGSLIRLCAALERQVIAEGVERKEELDVLCELGCDLFQGYLLARPGPPFPEVRW